MALERQKLQVLLDDGTEHEIVVGNPSLVAWDRTRVKRDWPTTDEAPMLWATFCAWHQMTAQKLIGCTYPEFEEGVCQAIEFPDGNTSDPVDPTQPTAEADSSSH